MRASLILIAAVLATPALAAEPPTAEAPIATASSAKAPLSTADQIDAYLKSSPTLAMEDGSEDAVALFDDRQPHGEISVGVGTHGYRSIYARTDLPVGETGRLSIAIENSRFDGRSGWQGARAYGGGLGLASPYDRQRCDLEAMNPARPLDAIGGPNGRCPSSFIGR